MHTHYADGCYRVWINNFPIFEISKHFGFALWLEFPSDWHEDSRALLCINLIWPQIFIGIPWPWRYKDYGQCGGPRIGFNFFGDLCWIYHGNDTGNSKDRGKYVTTIHMPWGWNHVRHSVMNTEGKMVEFVGTWDRDKTPDNRKSETHPYQYLLKSGEMQHRQATIFVEEMEWRRRFWFPRKMVRRNIDVSFDGEVGERTGSWKGGTVGCGYDLFEGESPLECLRRMEQERDFFR